MALLSLRLDSDAKGFIARAMVGSGYSGDFRNAEQIGEWSRAIAMQLKVPAATTAN